MPTLDEKIATAQTELEKAQGQVRFWRTRRDAFIGRVEALLELKAEAPPPTPEG